MADKLANHFNGWINRLPCPRNAIGMTDIDKKLEKCSF